MLLLDGGRGRFLSVVGEGGSGLVPERMGLDLEKRPAEEARRRGPEERPRGEAQS